MDTARIIGYLYEYGLILLFVVVFLEYFNLPGFPAGVILPATGFLIRQGNMNFWLALVVSVSAGTLGSILAYGVGKVGGQRLLTFLVKKFPKRKHYVAKYVGLIEKHGTKIVFIAKLTPVIRTLIGIPAGTLNMNFMAYLLYSLLGVSIWNIFFMGIGYMIPELYPNFF